MNSSKRKTATITFTIDDDEHVEIMEYAKSKGFRKLADLARFALIQYMTRYPIKASRAVQPESNPGK